MGAVEKASGLGRPEIVAAAKATYEAAKGKKYTWGGHSTKGFDCSGFVNYTLWQANPSVGVHFITAAQLFNDNRFTEVTDPQPGDLIGFRKGPGISHDHVGIVYDADHWIGSQSSTGVAPVTFSNPYWSTKPHFFLRLKY